MLSTAIKEMKKLIQELVDENKKLRNELEQLKSNKQLTNTTSNDEVIISEAMERIRRSTNLIIQGVPESRSNDALQSKAEDIQCVENLIGTAISNITEYKIVNISRLGSVHDNRPRLVKVAFDSAYTVNKLVRHRCSDKNIFFNRDLTVSQQNQAYNVRKEFRRRCDNGEENIRLKYENGIPKIVPRIVDVDKKKERKQTEQNTKNHSISNRQM
jgi:regulator of replication initiation timing